VLTASKQDVRHHRPKSREGGGMRVLVVEDEPVLADAIAEWLRE
jgi:hypothetical protein